MTSEGPTKKKRADAARPTVHDCRSRRRRAGSSGCIFVMLASAWSAWAEPVAPIAASSPAASASAPVSGRLAKDRPRGSSEPDYRLPAIEIAGFEFLLNRANRYFGSERD